MRHSALAFFAISSLLWTGVAGAATRPSYGGTLRVAMRSTALSLDPADPGQAGSLESSNFSSLIFDTLVTLDDRGKPQPSLATSWQADPGNQRWQFELRRRVSFQDGTPLTADQVAASLRVANPSWRIVPGEDAITIELDAPAPDLPSEVALARNGIAWRDGATIMGTGPFTIDHWEPGKKLTLAANDNYWGGRPFLNSVEIAMGQGFRKQMLALDLQQADLIEIAPEQERTAANENRRVESSAPAELMALVFSNHRPSADESRRRAALAQSIDRAVLSNVLLQGGGAAAGGLLPDWLSGYGFVFSVNADSTAARQVRNETGQSTVWSLAYDTDDPASRVVAERILLNARDAGMKLQLGGGGDPDVRLVRAPLISLNPYIALVTLAGFLRLAQPSFASDAPEGVYTAESALLRSEEVIPLLHLRMSHAMNAKVRGWSEALDGQIHWGTLWLAATP